MAYINRFKGASWRKFWCDRRCFCSGIHMQLIDVLTQQMNAGYDYYTSPRSGTAFQIWIEKNSAMGIGNFNSVKFQNNFFKTDDISLKLISFLFACSRKSDLFLN